MDLGHSPQRSALRGRVDLSWLDAPVVLPIPAWYSCYRSKTRLTVRNFPNRHDSSFSVNVKNPKMDASRSPGTCRHVSDWEFARRAIDLIPIDKIVANLKK